MEGLFDCVESNVVMLSAQDAMYSFANHPLVHFFENSERSPRFMPSNILQASLYTALREFPLLLGHVRKGPGGLAKVVIDKHNLNMPEFVESESSIHYKSLKDTQFEWSAWPRGVATVGPITTPSRHGVIKLLNVHVVRLHGNSGLIMFCNIPHLILDGIGYYDFLNRWAALCRESTFPESHAKVDRPTYIFDRSIVSERLKGQSHLEKHAVDMLTTNSAASMALGLLSFPTQLRLVSIGISLDPGRAHFFRVSSESLAELLDLAKARSNDCLADISTYALLAALVGTSFCRAQAAADAKRSLFVQTTAAISNMLATRPSQFTLVNMVHTHGCLKLDPDRCYIGNPVILHPVQAPAKQLALAAGEESLAEVAAQVSLALSGINASLVGGFLDAVSSCSNSYLRYAVYMATTANVLTVIDERCYNTNGVDFGDGGPAWVSGIPWHVPNFVAFFSSPARPGDVDLYVSLKPRTADALIQDRFFARYAQLLTQDKNQTEI
ncbi:hypothetical protein GGI20_000271 [Coemansia sp. BCRC 34301]|nr:hypothetical protein GGI20_000271 [Coemansia sp. BCRC 34301]